MKDGWRYRRQSIQVPSWRMRRTGRKSFEVRWDDVGEMLNMGISRIKGDRGEDWGYCILGRVVNGGRYPLLLCVCVFFFHPSLVGVLAASD